MRWKSLGFAALLAIGLVGQAHADLSYTYSSDMTSYTGTSVTVNVFLNETVSGTSQSLIGPNGSELGLFAAGVGLNLLSGNATITAATPNMTAFGANGTYNPGSNGTQLTPTNAAINEQLALSGGIPPRATAISSTVNQILLGSFTIMAGSTPSTFSLTSFSQAQNAYAQSQGDTTNTDPNGFLLDESSSDTGMLAPDGSNIIGTNDNALPTFTVQTAAVPEPSSMLLSALFLPVAGLGVWLRRRKMAVAAV